MSRARLRVYSRGCSRSSSRECPRVCVQDQNATVAERLQTTEAELSCELRQTREALASRSQELDSLKSEWNVSSSDRDVKHRQELTAEREKALQACAYKLTAFAQ